MESSTYFGGDHYVDCESEPTWPSKGPKLAAFVDSHIFKTSFVNKVSDLRTTPSETDDSSDADSMWSGSAPSTRMSSPALSGIYPFELFMSSLQTQDKRDEQSSQLSSDDRELSNDALTRSFGKLCTDSRQLPALKPERLPAPSRVTPSNHVDYLSHEWAEPDIWASWKYLAAESMAYPNRKRLANASWRAWGKCRSNLKTVSAGTINWLKDCDNTWLYGPLLHGKSMTIKDVGQNYDSKNTLQNASAGTTASPRKKPILKRKENVVEIEESETILSRSQSAGSLLNHEAIVATRKVEGASKEYQMRPVVEKFTTSEMQIFSSLPSIASVAEDSPRKEHVHFSFEVEQRIALDNSDEDSSDREHSSAEDGDSSSDEGIVFMKRSKKKRSSTPPPRRRTWTRALPSTHLKWLDDDNGTLLDEYGERYFLPCTSSITHQAKADEDHLFWELSDSLQTLDIGARNGNKMLSSPMPRNISFLRNAESTITTLELVSRKWTCQEEYETKEPGVSIPKGFSDLQEETWPFTDEHDIYLSRSAQGNLFDSNNKPRLRPETTMDSSAIRMPPGRQNFGEEDRLLFDLADLDSCHTESNLPSFTMHKRNRIGRLVEGPAALSNALRGSGTGHKAETYPSQIFYHDSPFDRLAIDHREVTEPSEESDEDHGYETTTESHSDESTSDEGLYEHLCKAEDSLENTSHLESALTPLQKGLVDRIMVEFWTIFNQSWSQNLRICAGDNSSQTGEYNINYSSTQNSTTRKRRKRDEDSGDGNSDRRKQDTPSTSSNNVIEGGDVVKFACPYRKHDPQLYNLYSHSVCTISHWATISRVKEHLYRAHRIPVHCKRCWEQFKSQALLDAHITVAATDICDLQPGAPPEGISMEQERRLRSRKKASPSQSDEDRWREIYKILFPDEEIPSPYFEPVQDELPMSPDSRDLAGYEQYIRRELPRLVRSNIEEAVRREMQPLEASLVSNLVTIVRDCQDAVFRSYRQSQGLSDDALRPPSVMEEVLPPPLQSNSEASALNDTGTEHVISPHQDFIHTVWQAPPSMSPLTAASSMLPEAPQIPDLELSPLDRQSQADSGYVSEQIHFCGCYGPCSCSSICESGQVAAQDLILGSHQNEWIDWGVFPTAEPFDSTDGFSWKVES